MTVVASRDLRNHTAEVLNKVADGEEVTVTVYGRPVAVITRPRSARPTSFRKQEFVAFLDDTAADVGLHSDLAWISPDTTDDLE